MKNVNKKSMLLVIGIITIVFLSSIPTQAFSTTFRQDVRRRWAPGVPQLQYGGDSIYYGDSYFIGKLDHTSAYAEITSIQLYYFTSSFAMGGFDLKYVKFRLYLKVGSIQQSRDYYAWGPSDDATPWHIENTKYISSPNLRVYSSGEVYVTIKCWIHYKDTIDGFEFDKFAPSLTFYCGRIIDGANRPI